MPNYLRVVGWSSDYKARVNPGNHREGGEGTRAH